LREDILLEGLRMAGDWIKIQSSLYRHPKVCAIAELLISEDNVMRNVIRNAVVGALVSVWATFRHRGRRKRNDLIVSGYTLGVIDDIADLPGFGQAMRTVGWVSSDQNILVFPRFFEEFNTDPADRLVHNNRERQRRFRAKHTRNVTRNAKSNVREEKRREEYIKKNKSSKPTPKSTWLTPFWDLWKARYDAELPASAFADLKALVEQHATQKVLEHLGRYLDGLSDPRFISFSKFRSTFGAYNGETRTDASRSNLGRVQAKPGKYANVGQKIFSTLADEGSGDSGTASATTPPVDHAS
jgi:hypothetical protein